MTYVARPTRDSGSLLIPVLLATSSVALIALIWRRLAAPRSQAARHDTNALLAAPPTRAVGAGDDTQAADTGSGALFHREYAVRLTGTGLSSGRVLRLIHRHMTDLAPSPLAHFEKTAGHDGLLRVGDEYDITMLGPWNGKVRVSESSLEHFTLVTLEGHPEAGHITFRVATDDDKPDTLTVLIESWARARDAVVHAAYATLGIGKQIQTEVWITFLQRLAALTGMDGTPEVRILTEELATDPHDPPSANVTADG